MTATDILKRQVELQAGSMYARGENPTCWRIAEALGKTDLTFSHIEPLLKLWKEKHRDPDLRYQVYWRLGSREAALERLEQESNDDG